MKIVYKPMFVWQYKKLPQVLQEEVKEKISLFRKNPRHPSLRTHKLKGKLQGTWSFSVNFKYRIIYEPESKNRVVLLDVGDHGVYEK